ncbi:MAG: molybdopterin-dependent oxidoreductase, partial [Deferribacteraceae bacterium]|nr:molybdopterin-dependent oxidoreductase [Deferribacteraceae bacterium]
MSKNKNSLTRRSFLKWSAAAAALSSGLTACGSGGGDETIVAGGGGPQDKPDSLLSGGKWVSVSCPQCSKFQCVNRVYMVDGIPVRQKTQDDHPHSPDYPVFRSCIKGRSMRWSIFSPDRLKYPMKRKNWQPGGGANSTPHLRGKDEWVRISWDEAINTIASESRRICETYVPNSEKWVFGADIAGGYSSSTKYGKYMPILNLCYSAGMEPKFLNWLGYGSMPMYGQNSTGGWPVVRNKIETSGALSADRFDIIEKAKVIVHWGQNHAWTMYGATQLTWRAAKERGAKIYCVDPWFSFGNNSWVDEWIPVRPGTDTALLLAVAWVLIDEGLVKTSFLDNNTVGYDEDHMPIYDKVGNELKERLILDTSTGTFTEASIVIDDPRPGRTGYRINKYYKLNFKDYVLGTYDGRPKDPNWASAICGTPVAKIYELARVMGNVNNPSEELVFTPNQAPGRHYHGTTMAQTFLTVSWLLGGPIGSSFGGQSYGGAFQGYYPQAGAYFGQYDLDYPPPFYIPTKKGDCRSTYNVSLDAYVSGKANPKAAGAYGAIAD